MGSPPAQTVRKYACLISSGLSVTTMTLWLARKPLIHHAYLNFDVDENHGIHDFFHGNEKQCAAPAPKCREIRSVRPMVDSGGGAIGSGPMRPSLPLTAPRNRSVRDRGRLWHRRRKSASKMSFVTGLNFHSMVEEIDEYIHHNGCVDGFGTEAFTEFSGGP